MPRQARTKSKTQIYHIMWRGANRQEIFHDEEDWKQFLDTLKKYKLTCELTFYAWCLMGNHVHLLIKEGNEDISATMKRIGVSYAGYYNWKYRTTGHLFQDRFKSENVETKQYLLTAVRYIHQNPVKAGIVGRCDAWKWSSCLGYYDKQNDPTGLLNCRAIIKMFSDDITIARERFKQFNEQNNDDQCLEDQPRQKRLTDEEARLEIMKWLGLGAEEIAQVKSLPKVKRQEVLRKVKEIDGLSLRQAARIFGVSLSLISRA
jgi:REP element-mobilizing transposase RayT